MAYGTNEFVPDDQVLGVLLDQGDWLKRASYGWLPAAYLRLMPDFYRGVVPVIEHDHGSETGSHSTSKPIMPPVSAYVLTDPNHPSNADLPKRISKEEYQKEREAR